MHPAHAEAQNIENMSAAGAPANTCILVDITTRRAGKVIEILAQSIIRIIRGEFQGDRVK